MALIDQTNYEEALRKRIVAARIAANLRQSDVATFLGISEGQYAKYEGRSPIPVYFLGILADLIQVEIATLVYGKARRKPRSRRAPVTVVAIGNVTPLRKRA